MMRSEHHRSALWAHAVDSHGFVAGQGGQAVAQKMFSMKITASYKSSSKRLISEALQIESEVQKRDQAARGGEGQNREVLNSVRQWHQPGIIRVKARRNLDY